MAQPDREQSVQPLSPWTQMSGRSSLSKIATIRLKSHTVFTHAFLHHHRAFTRAAHSASSTGRATTPHRKDAT
jgi:hypothetical protein